MSFFKRHSLTALFGDVVAGAALRPRPRPPRDDVPREGIALPHAGAQGDLARGLGRDLGTNTLR